MNIALYNVDSKIPNLALMKLSAYHKSLGDSVEWYSPLLKKTYDKIYGSKIFSFSDNGYISKDMAMGGSGFDLEIQLPEYIEHIYPDYSLYPKCDYALGFITRGCIRKCPFCIVWKKEGTIRFNAHLTEFCKDQKKVRLLDNNILAYTDHIKLLEECRDSGKRIDFNQGLDIRLLTKKNAQLIKDIKKWNNIDIRFSFDDIELENIVREKTKILKEVGISRAMFYVLIGYNSTKEEDIKRVEILKELGHRIYIMPYNKYDKYQHDFYQWVRLFLYMKYSFDKCKV